MVNTFSVGQSLLSWAKFSIGKPKSATSLWLIKAMFFPVISLYCIAFNNQLQAVAVTNWLLRDWLCNILNLWVTTFDCTGHLLGNLSPNNCSLTQTTITQKKFANTHCLVYKCRQIANALQAVWVSLRQWAQFVSNTSLCSRRPGTSGWKMVVWSLIYGRSCPLNL